MTRPVRHLRAVPSRDDLRGRINLALSLLSHRNFCTTCDPTLDLVREALAGATIDQLRKKDEV